MPKDLRSTNGKLWAFGIDVNALQGKPTIVTRMVHNVIEMLSTDAGSLLGIDIDNWLTSVRT